MGDFKRDRFDRKGPRGSEGGARFERRDNFERRDRPDRFSRPSSGRFSQNSEMHQVVCDGCGKDCEVPFKPTAGKPVYCNDCFRSNKGGRDSPTRSGSSNQCNCKEELERVNQKLETVLGILQGMKKQPVPKTEEVVVAPAIDVEATVKKKRKSAKKK
ncbi:MAG: CxxC-x17-CxxC domain-containing protein [archaeon]